MKNDPLGPEELLEKFYRPEPEKRAAAPREKKDKPTHYKIVCISLYNEDIEHLERLVAELKRRGHTKANKSQLIRAALDQVDLSKIPKGY
jgi:hypothetical protein